MVGSTRQTLRPGAPIPTNIDPTGIFEAFMQRMEHLGNQNQNNHLQPPIAFHPPLRQTGDKLLERFRALRPEKFDGLVDPRRVEQWLREMDLIF